MFELFLLLVVFVEAAAIAALFSSSKGLEGRLRRVELLVPFGPPAAPPAPMRVAPVAAHALAPRAVVAPQGIALPATVWGPPAPPPPSPPPPPPREIAPTEALAARVVEVQPSAEEKDALEGERYSEPPGADAAAEAPDAADDVLEKGSPIDWERWLGVRGAAAVGAILLVVALLYFLRYSISAGWLTVAARVGLGAGVSAACVVGSRIRLPRTHRVLASWIAGAGIAGLYASAWAGAWLAHLYGPVAAFGFGVGITTLAVGLALHANSLPIALLGFVGAFAAPLALLSGNESPFAVVVYVVVLDVGAIVLALRKKWWSLALLSVIVSAAYEAVFVAARGGDALLPLHFGIAIAFAALFGLAPMRRGASKDDQMPRPIARAVMYAALLASFGLAAPLAAKLAVGVAGLPVVGLVVVLSVAAAALAHREKEPGLALVGAVAGGAVMFVWTFVGARAESASIAIAIAAVLVPLPLGALAAHTARAGAKTGAADKERVQTVVGALFLSVAIAAVLVCVSAFRFSASTAPALVALASLAAILVWTGRRAADDALAVAALGGFTLSTGVLALAARDPRLALFAGAIGPAVSAVVAWPRRSDAEPAARAWLAVGARASGVIALLAIAPHAGTLSFGSFTALLSLVVPVLLFARPAGSGESTIVLGPMVAGVLLFRAFATEGVAGAGPLRVVGAVLAAVVVFGPPLVARLLAEAEHRRSAPAQAAALVAFAAVFIAAPGTLDGDVALTVSVTLLGVAGSALALFVAHVRRGADDVTRLASRSLAPVTAAAMLGAAGMGLEREVAPLALAGMGAAAVLPRSLVPRSPVGDRVLASLAAVAIGLSVVGVSLNPIALSFHVRAVVPVLNWTLVVWGVPAICAVFALARLSTVDPDGEDVVAAPRAAIAVAALVVVFAWINVAILDAFATGPRLSFDRAATWSREGRDLAMSGAWATYGVGLLVVGMKRGASALRKVSLGVVLLTMAKVFLYDLSALEDLYRVASLVGLAVSLIGISLLYQRFVFRAAARSVAPSPGTASPGPQAGAPSGA